jgi:protein O-mannosyl-transferase
MGDRPARAARLLSVRFTPLRLFLIFAALSFLLYLPALRGEFIMDDWGYITQSSWVTESPSPAHYWTTFEQADYWPLSYTSYWVFYRLFGENPLPYHVVNVLVHALNGLLVLAIARRFGVRWPIWVALLFLVHPLHVQAVAWIIQFKTLLSTTMALASILFYQRFLQGEGRREAWFSLAAFALAMLAKGSAIFLPFLLLAMTIRRPRRDLVFLLAFFALSVLGGLTTMMVNNLNFVDRAAPVFHMSVLERPALMIQNLFFYVKSFVLPVGLSYLYPLTVPSPGAVLNVLILVSIVALGCLAWRYRWMRGRGLFLFGYLVLLAPGLGLVSIPNMKLSLVADHYAYLPDAFLAIFLGSIVATYDSRMFRTAMFVPLLVLAILGFRHARSFATEEAFWRRADEVNPGNAAPAFNLGTVYGKKKRVEDSIEQYRRAVQLDPAHDRAWFNMGRAYMLLHDAGNAEQCLLRVVSLNPRMTMAYIGLSQVYLITGRATEARQIVEKGLQLNPGDPDLAARLDQLPH